MAKRDFWIREISEKYFPRSQNSRIKKEKKVSENKNYRGYVDIVCPLRAMTVCPLANEGRQYRYCTCIASPALKELSNKSLKTIAVLYKLNNMRVKYNYYVRSLYIFYIYNYYLWQINFLWAKHVHKILLKKTLFITIHI